MRSAVRAVGAVIAGAAAVLWLGTAAGRPSPATLRSTSTSVTCPSVILIGQTGTCEAVVSDTDTGTATTPSGTVDFSASSTIEFSGTPVCTLSAAGSCQIAYTGSLGTATITASYDGDPGHATSSATQEILVTAPIGPGPLLCYVPRLTGKTVAQARQALRHFRCRPGRISHAFSKRIEKGRVISQKPGPHKVFPADDRRVRLVVSRGKRP
jgi:hypothetical protein